MTSREAYEAQVALLVRILPAVAEESVFALKGGTAINLFIRDLPRLSVDIDLTYLPVQPWAASLQGIEAGLRRIAEDIVRRVGGSKVAANRSVEGHVERLYVQLGATVKVEVSPVLRGVVFAPEMRSVSPVVEDRFGFVSARVVSLPDLYAGKIVAALDRQHPRDLFDVMLLLRNEGVDDDLRRAFVAYLLQSRKPLNAVLEPVRRDLSGIYDREFRGMTDLDPGLEALLEVRETLVETMAGGMPDMHRRFLMSFKRGKPDWDLLGLPHVADLPAVRFRIQKFAALSPEARAVQVGRLEQVLFGQRGDA